MTRLPEDVKNATFGQDKKPIIGRFPRHVLSFQSECVKRGKLSLRFQTRRQFASKV